MNKPLKTVEEELAELEDTIKYENAMYESCLAYPTETEQFYHALEATRERIAGLYKKQGELRQKLSEHFNGEGET